MAMAVTVKNTFLHLDVPSGATGAERRATSVPKSLKLAGEEGADKGGKGSPRRAPSSCAEASTEADLSEAEVGSFSSTPQPTPRADATATAPQGPSLDFAQMQYIAPVFPAMLTPSGGLAAPPAPPPPPAPTPGGGGADAPPRQRLNSKAQAWTPGGASALQPRGGAAGLSSMQIGAFLQQFAALVSAAAAAVQQALGGADVQASDGPSGLAIVVQLPLAEFQQRRDEALAFARQALLQAARAAGNKVHVLGSMGNPFVATPFGCSAMLGAVADEKQACWDSLAHGYCHRGHACRWQHPLCRSTVNIMVKIAEG